MVVYFKILKYLVGGLLIGLLLYMILSNLTVTVQIDAPTYQPCPPYINDKMISCPS